MVLKKSTKEDRAYCEHTNVVLIYVHKKGQCKGTYCTLHNRSNHHLRSWPQLWDPQIFAMQRICEHGVAHTDPDEINTDVVVRFEHESQCDGCCVPRG
jgi:hypothetical protein